MNEEYRRYTAAFMFIDTMPKRVLLVRKTHPRWQEGLLNAIGGEIEGEEDPLDCMRREFKEEVGFDFDAWNFFCREAGPGYEVYFYRMTFDERVLYDSLGFRDRNENDKGEELVWSEVPVKEPVIGNLNWLIPLALDPRPISVGAYPKGDIRKLKTW
jgi:8-oxo-dGTP pyrophosphatase MutT (NUDIX family)